MNWTVASAGPGTVNGPLRRLSVKIKFVQPASLSFGKSEFLQPFENSKWRSTQPGPPLEVQLCRKKGILEDHPHSKLQLATTLLGSVDAEIAAVQIIGWAEPIHMIEQVIVLRPQLQSEPFGSVNILK